MILLKNSLNAWGSPDFTRILKKELEQLDADALPLQKGLLQSSAVSRKEFNVMILNETDGVHSIQVKIGVFYFGVNAGCSCADDPSTIDENNEYCELLIEIDKSTAVSNARLLS